MNGSEKGARVVKITKIRPTMRQAIEVAPHYEYGLYYRITATETKRPL